MQIENQIQTCFEKNIFEINEFFSLFFSLESTGASASPSASGNVANAASTGIYSEVKACPRCQVLAVKMHDGSCNHMTCAVCGVEFCWLCMKEISDLHYLSPSGNKGFQLTLNNEFMQSALKSEKLQFCGGI